MLNVNDTTELPAYENFTSIILPFNLHLNDKKRHQFHLPDKARFSIICISYLRLHVRRLSQTDKQREGQTDRDL